MRYVRFCKGLVDRGSLVPETNVPEFISTIDRNQDWYQSVFFYNEDQRKIFDEKHTIKGIKDVITNRLVFDFDHEIDPEIAKADAITLVNKLSSMYNINPTDLQIYFSGNKGFNVIVPLNREIDPPTAYQLAEKFAGDLPTWDTTLYDAPQLLRIPGTRHPTSGLYKTQIAYCDLMSKNIDSIRNRASEPRPDKSNTKEIEIVPAFFDIPKVDAGKNVIPEYKIDLSKKPKGWKNCKWSLQQGNFKQGERQHALMALAATLRAMGMDYHTSYYMCKSALKKSHREHGEGGTNKDELFNKIIKQIFIDDGWQGGSYSCKTDPWMSNYCKSLGEYACKDREEEPPVIALSSMERQFQDYANSFEQNVIKTGINDLDEHATLCASTLNGLLGQPGCHAKGTEVLMFDGSCKKVEEIEIGDLLMGPDSKPREVLRLCRGRDKMYRIIPIKGEPFVVNAHHVLNLKPSIGTNNKAFECNLNINVDDYINKTTKVVKARYKLNRVSVEFKQTQPLNIDPYILGVWLADGTSSLPAITNTDDVILEVWRSYAKEIGCKTTERSKFGVTTSSIVGDQNENVLLIALREVGVLNNKHIPYSYLCAEREQRLALLAGLLDTDGHLDNNRTGFDFISKYKILTHQVVFLVRSLGLAAYLKEEKKGCWYNGNYKEGTYYRCHISGHTNIIPTRITRKKARPRKMRKDVLVTGFSYEDLGEGDYYGFTLDQDHLYLTSDFIVHHNSGKTTVAIEYLRNTSKQGVPSMFFSLDMGLPIVYAKLVQKRTSVDFKSVMRLFREDPIKSAKIAAAVSDDYNNVGFNFRSGMTIADMKNAITQQQDRIGRSVKLVVIDYLECIAGPYADATANTGFIANQLKDMANEFGVCVLLLLQTQKHSTPSISDPLMTLKAVKGSSIIEQSCSTILTLWREGYNPDTIEDDRYISFAIVKNRFGSLWRGDFAWDGVRGSIRSLSDEEKENLKAFKDKKTILRLEALKAQPKWQGDKEWL